MTDNTADAEQNKKRLMGMGAQQFLIKPIAVETLVREVRRQLA
jgi:DNA-binding response OmpR family regulator